MKTLKDIFDSNFKLKVTKEIASEIYAEQIRFISKGQEYIEFFGGNLTGVHVIKFTPNDEQNFFDIFETSKDEIKFLVNQAPGINKSFIVSSDPYNLFVVYIMYLTYNSNYINKAVKHNTLINLSLLLHYKFLTSLVNHFFRYPIDKATAEVVYNNLSFKYILKQKGNWSSTLEYRSEELMSDESIHLSTIKTFKDDSNIVYMLNDTQGRLRDMIKNIYREFLKVKESGIKYNKTSHIQLDDENGDSFKDKTHGLENYDHYLFKILQNDNDFIKEELVDVILDLIPNTDRMSLVKTLEYTVDKHIHDKMIEEYFHLVIHYAYNQMLEDINILANSKDIGNFLSILRNYYQSSKNKDPDLLKLRSMGDKFTKEALDIKTYITITSVRTSHFLYTCLRVFTMHYYS